MPPRDDFVGHRFHFRFQNQRRIYENYFALNDKCPHAYLSLKGSDIDIKNQAIWCRWHKSAFCYKTGEVREWMKISNFHLLWLLHRIHHL